MATAVITKVIEVNNRSSGKLCIIFVQFQFNLNFRQILVKPPISNFKKIHPEGAKLFHGGRQTDRYDKFNHHFSQHCKMCVKKNLLHIPLHTRSVRKVSDRIFLCEHLMDYNLARLHEPTLNLSAHA